MKKHRMPRSPLVLVLPLIVSAAIFAGGSSEGSVSTAPDGTGATNGWVTWRGPNGNGTIVSEKFNPKFPENPKNVLWRKTVGYGYSSLAVTDARMYTMGTERKDGKETEIVYCLDRKNGNEIWKASFPISRRYEYPGSRAMPVPDGENLYVFGAAGTLSCLSAKNGKVKWQKDVMAEGSMSAEWGFSSTPVIEGNLVLVNACLAGMAFDKTTGDLVWKTEKGPNGYATPVVFTANGKRLMAVFGAASLSITDVADGNVLGSYRWYTSYYVNAADPVVFPDGKLFASSDYGTGSRLLDFSSGSFVPVWEKKTMGTHFSSFIVKDGYLYGVDGSALQSYACKLSCMNVATGDIVWERKTGAYGSVIMVNDVLVFLEENGDLSTLEANPSAYTPISTGKIFQGRGVAWVAPVFWDGCVYLRSNIGEIVCVRADR